MTRFPTAGLALLTTTLLLSAAPALAQDDAEIIERGRALTEAFYAGELDGIVEAFDAQMREVIPDVATLDGFRDQILGAFGDEAEVLDEEVNPIPGHRVYQRTVRFQNTPENPMVVVWAFDEEDRISGFSVQPAGNVPTEADTPHLAYETRAELRLPFEDEWTVFWGGRTVQQNYHAAHLDQRFAYDLIVVEDGVRVTDGDGSANEHYLCFGRTIVAPAGGVVVAAEDGITDNRPGRMNPSEPLGNHVILDLGTDEFAFLAHLREGTVQVATGDRVEPGDPLGECGNSGNSSEPHLHFHLQNTPDFGGGEGIPAFFHHYLADGEPVERGEPVRGQRIRPAGSNSR